MLDLMVGTLSILSFAVTYRRITNCSLNGAVRAIHEKTAEGALVGPERIVHSASYSNIRCPRGMTIHAIGLLWCLNYTYHYMIAKVFIGETLLNMVNIMTAILSFICFCQAMYHQVASSRGRIQSVGNGILLETRNYWDLILAGTVLVQLLLREIEI